MTRYALYTAPDPAGELWRLGSSVLGWDAAGAREVAHPQVGPSAAEWRAWTAEPRVYGFHGTLKAPFSIAAGATEAALVAALGTFCAGRAPFAVTLRVEAVGPWIALTPRAPTPAIHDLADACVRDFEPFRAPLTAAERARRRPERLTVRQVELLDAWGYPLVFDAFDFHMTLTGALAPDDQARALAALTPLFAPVLEAPTRVDAVALFRQDEGPFRVVARVPFARSRE